VEQFEEATTFTVAWLPGPFIAREIADRALERVYCAIVPGGWLVFGFNPPPHGRLEEALASLRVVRSGGYPWTPREVEEKLQEHVSSKSKCTRPRRQFRLSLPHPSARSCLWSGDGQCHLKISAAAPRLSSDRKRRNQ
jgi:hypothetical protein